MRIETLPAASSTPPPFAIAEEPAEAPATFVLAAPRTAPPPAAVRRLDWAALGAAAFVYAIAFLAWVLLAR